MPSITSQIADLFRGIFNTVTAALGSVMALIQGIVNFVLSVFGSTLRACGDVISGFAHIFEGVLKFLMSESSFSSPTLGDRGSTEGEE